MSAENKALVRRLYDEVWNKRRIELVDDLLSRSHAIRNNHLPDSGIGPDAYKREVARFIRAFPDLRFSVEETIAEKDKVVASWVISGTHKGEFRGISATNKTVSIEGMTVHVIADGKIIDSYVTWDELGLRQQLGAAPGSIQSKTAVPQ